MVQAAPRTNKASKRRDSIEINAATVLRICYALRKHEDCSWLHCADILGIPLNQLRTLRKNAEK